MKIIQTVGKRKRAVARGTVKAGSGCIRINSQPITSYFPSILRQIRVSEPLVIADELAKKVDINVRVAGGGTNGQADAVRLAIATGILQFTKNKELEKAYNEYDRQLLVADVRRKEPCKPNTSKARAKRQKSYR